MSREVVIVEIVFLENVGCGLMFGVIVTDKLHQGKLLRVRFGAGVKHMAMLLEIHILMNQLVANATFIKHKMKKLLKKVKYEKLNTKQKENYNFAKVASALADYGYNSIRLSDDYNGADFIALHVNGKDLLRIQLKGHWTIDKKYLRKDLYIVYVYQAKKEVWIYKHDDMVKVCNKEKIYTLSDSWVKHGTYSNVHPKKLMPYMTKL